MEKVNWKQLKCKVGVYDIAYYLGYRLNKAAGVGRYIEMELTNNKGKQDTIIIKNPQIKGEQMFWRRTGTSKPGDVISLIRENLNSFGVDGRNEWDVVSKVLGKFANEPIPEYEDSIYIKAHRDTPIFNIDRYETIPAQEELHLAMSYFRNRNINEETVKTFSPFVSLIRDKNNENYKSYNLGFPYHEPDKSKEVGFEIRGYNGFKSKADGTNSSTGAWIADFSQNNPINVKDVYFAESAFDVMAFWQINKEKINLENSVFVSLGGTFSDKQIIGIMAHYNEARAVDCFDNDLAGRLSGIRMAALLEKTNVEITKKDDSVIIKSQNKEWEANNDEVSLSEYAKHFPFRYKVGQWKAPKIYKDWNDVTMNKRIENDLNIKTKFQRNEILSNNRKALAI